MSAIITPQYGVSNLAVSQKGSNIYYVSNNKLYRSIDFGQTFTEYSLDVVVSSNLLGGNIPTKQLSFSNTYGGEDNHTEVKEIYDWRGGKVYMLVVFRQSGLWFIDNFESPENFNLNNAIQCVRLGTTTNGASGDFMWHIDVSIDGKYQVGMGVLNNNTWNMKDLQIVKADISLGRNVLPETIGFYRDQSLPSNDHARIHHDTVSMSYNGDVVLFQVNQGYYVVGKKYTIPTTGNEIFNFFKINFQGLGGELGFNSNYFSSIHRNVHFQFDKILIFNREIKEGVDTPLLLEVNYSDIIYTIDNYIEGLSSLPDYNVSGTDYPVIPEYQEYITISSELQRNIDISSLTDRVYKIKNNAHNYQIMTSYQFDYTITGGYNNPVIVSDDNMVTFKILSVPNYSMQHGFNFARNIYRTNYNPIYTIYNTATSIYIEIGIFKVPCFKEGTCILALQDNKEKYTPIEQLQEGDYVKTFRNGYVPIYKIGHRSFQNFSHDERIKDRIYLLTPSQYPSLNEDLYLTGCHSVLEDELTEIQRKKSVETMSRLFVTDSKYRLWTMNDERAIPYQSDEKTTVWHFALEHPDEKMNYGVFANGLLVECTSKLRMDSYFKSSGDTIFNE